jgi:hypothetical protein
MQNKVRDMKPEISQSSQFNFCQANMSARATTSRSGWEAIRCFVAVADFHFVIHPI